MTLSFVGIQNPYAIGEFSVEQNSKVLQRYRFIHESLTRVLAGKLPALENWDLKLATCKHLYENAEAAHLFRNRITELRTSSMVLNKDPDPILVLFMDELIHAQNDLEFATGLYDVILPALRQTYRKQMKGTQQIVDQPTIRIFRSVLLDLEEQIQWGQELLEELRKLGIYVDQAIPFKRRLETYLTAAGGIDCLGEKSKILPSRWRSHEAYHIPMKSARDPRKMGPVTFERTGVANPPEDPAGQRVVMMMRVRQEEMTACELVAGVLYSQKNMPWEFYYTLARHIWDEARHAMFGQAALEAEGYDWISRPQYTLDYDMTAPKIPAATYAWLSIAVEEGAMISNGKKSEYEFCRDEAKHSLMTRFQDYDWADEVVHANFGRRWTPEMFGAELSYVREIAKHEMENVMQLVSEQMK